MTFAIFIGIWYLYSWSRFDNPAQRRNALPYPHTVITDGFLPLWDESNGLRPILGYMWPTVKVTLIGLGISIVLGIAIAVVMNLSKGMERALFPYAVILQTVPILAITPLLTQLFGDEIGVRLVVVVLIAIFPVITNTLFGLQSTDRLHHDLFTLNRVSRWTRSAQTRTPVRVAGDDGRHPHRLGRRRDRCDRCGLLLQPGREGDRLLHPEPQQRAANRPEMFAGTITASMFGVVMFLIVGAITARAIRNWHESAAASRPEPPSSRSNTIKGRTTT